MDSNSGWTQTLDGLELRVDSNSGWTRTPGGLKLWVDSNPGPFLNLTKNHCVTYTASVRFLAEIINIVEPCMTVVIVVVQVRLYSDKSETDDNVCSASKETYNFYFTHISVVAIYGCFFCIKLLM